MPMTCVAYGCKNHFVKGCGKQFFRFPMKDPNRLSKWVLAIRRKDWNPCASSRICSDHFTENDYMIRPGAMVPRLRLDAVPSIFDGFPDHLKVRLERQKKMKKKTDEQIIVHDNRHGSQDAVQANPTGNNQLEGNITVPSEILETRLHEISNKESLSVKKQQVKHGPVERSRTVTCVVHGCNSIFVKGCEKRFFRFPMKRPEHLSKWVKAVKCCDWKPSATSRICSDHFKDKDYIMLPGIPVPRLSFCAVPSVFKARKCRRKPVTATHQNFGDCRSMKVVDGLQETEKHSAYDHTYSTFHNEESLLRFTPDTMKLKKKVRTLQRQIQRQRHTIKRLSKTIEQLKGNGAQHHQN
ncbi:uncharacterized protein [Ranitomeya imitator]|uniref:uncharacterized protein n=1 Tax=Ranitomeya imitator TaxID=111125 RepID=UPI0037E7D6DC